MSDEVTWVRDGLIWRSARPRPADEPEPEIRPAGTCADCGRPTSDKRAVRCMACHCRRMSRQSTDGVVNRLAGSFAKVPPTTRPEPTFCACGCLIAVGEDCPACQVWALEVERRWNWHGHAQKRLWMEAS